MQLSDKEQLEIIKLRLLTNDISYKQAQELAKEYIDSINNKSREIAKKYNQKAKLINFSSLMR